MQFEDVVMRKVNREARAARWLQLALLTPGRGKGKERASVAALAQRDREADG